MVSLYLIGEPFGGPIGLSPPPNSTVTVSAINCLGQRAMEVRNNYNISVNKSCRRNHIAEHWRSEKGERNMWVHNCQAHSLTFSNITPLFAATLASFV